jgi:predicted ester cyclase
MSQVETNKALAREFFRRIWNEREEAAIDALHDENAVGNDPDFGTGKEAFRAHWKTWMAAFPDLHFEIVDIIGEGEKVLTRWRLTGTHLGPGDFMGVAPGGRTIDVMGMSLDTIRGGLVVEGCDGWDAYGLRKQLGALPAD